MNVAALMWIVAAASLVATVANIKRRRWCFPIWAVTNSAWMLYDAWLGAYAQAALMAVYVGLAFWGLYEWSTGKEFEWLG